MDRKILNLVLKEIRETEALLEKIKGPLQELRARCQKVEVSYMAASASLRQVQATIRDLMREIAEMPELPKDRKRKACSDIARI
jgi:hypothetical protein